MNENMLNELTEIVKKAVLENIELKLQTFAKNLAELPEMKEKNISEQDILEEWKDMFQKKSRKTVKK